MDTHETAQNQEPTSTIQSKPPKKTNLGVKKMVGPTKKTRSMSSRKQSLVPTKNVVVQEHDDQDDEKVQVEQKIVALQRIVPGGEDLGVDKLFEETAGYIKLLQNQVMAMRALTSFFEQGLEKKKKKKKKTTMLGGGR